MYIQHPQLYFGPWSIAQDLNLLSPSAISWASLLLLWNPIVLFFWQSSSGASGTIQLFFLEYEAWSKSSRNYLEKILPDFIWPISCSHSSQACPDSWTSNSFFRLLPGPILIPYTVLSTALTWSANFCREQTPNSLSSWPKWPKSLTFPNLKAVPHFEDEQD